MGEGTNHYDVIIVGAGSVGVPAAMALAEAGLSVLVLDERASVGQGSNKAAIGGVRATHSDPAKIRLNLRSIEILSTWKERHGDDIGWRTGGYVFVAYGEKEKKTLLELLAVQQSYGLEIGWLDADALLSRVPALEKEGLLGGTFSPDDGHCSPLLALHAIFDRAKRLGAKFHFGERVQSIEVTGGAVRGVVTDRGRYEAPVLINAAGVGAPAIGAMVNVKVPVRPDEHEAGITEPVAHFIDPLVVDIRPGPGSANCYFYQNASGQVVFCLTPSPLQWGTDTRETSAFLPMAARRLVALAPRLAPLRVRRTWRGLYPMTPDGSPIVGFAPEPKGFLVAAGMCGQGFMLGPGVGELLARMVTGKMLSSDEEILARMSPERSFGVEERLK